MKSVGRRLIYSVLVAIPVLLMGILMNVLMMEDGTATTMLVIKNILALLLVGVYIYYVFLYHRHIRFNKILFLITTTTLTIAISFLLINQSFLLMPMLIAPMLIAIIIDRQLAIVTNVISVLLVGFVGVLPIQFFLFYIVAGIVSALIIVMAKERTKIFYVVGIIAGFNLSYYLILEYALNVKVDILSSLVAAGNGALTLIIVIGSLPLWETVFRVMTPIKLIEYTNVDHKLLQRMIMESPGTYHHSAMVGSLAERAATKVGADSLLCKAGALFHDVGKLKESNYFIENQNGMPNPHDDIAADASAKIIIDHTANGLKLAKEHKLPKGIVDIIVQHHGTSLIKYFYHKANNYNDGVTYEEKDFRHNGPKPKTNEAAIVMLADCVEAYVRSIDEKDRDMERIKEIIKEVFDDKLEDGQLDECDLKIKELPLVAEAFMQVYTGLYHDRVKYPAKTVE